MIEPFPDDDDQTGRKRAQGACVATLARRVLRHATIVSVVSALASGGYSAAAAAEPWLGADKPVHGVAGAAAAVVGYGAATLTLRAPWQRALCGLGASLVAGLGKEAWDAGGHGDPSARDVVWTAAGGLVSSAILLAFDRTSGRRSGAVTRPSPPALPVVADWRGLSATRTDRLAIDRGRWPSFGSPRLPTCAPWCRRSSASWATR